MGRVALSNTKTIILSVVLGMVFIGAGAVAIATIDAGDNTQTKTNNHQVSPPSTKTTYISYIGEEGTDALTLLKKQVIVKTKHYDFGDLVTSINNTEGSGPKYWTLYVNGKMSEVGASSYVTTDSDKIEWKLQ
jgi:hypothetical protein